MTVTRTGTGWRPDLPLNDTPRPQRAHGPRSRRSMNAAFALLLMVVGAGGAVWFATDDRPQVDVVTLARPLPRGHVVTPSDLAVLRVTVDGGTVRLTTPQVARQALVGKPLLLDLPAGTLVAPEMVGSTAPSAGLVTLGVKVPEDGLPSSALRPGEPVDVLGFDPATGTAEILVRGVTVTEISRPATDDRGGDTVVYLAVPEQAAGAVAAAAGGERGVRLLGGGR
ncbi:SAF domain-containing protein [Protofrankia symbiont of Coriaria ruscifolia]|uniref:SAF domain-containing protein n=1 Tax=Protofrankia symbiont of Coriaria ruscifolia TaxID=1306542 RepID=UPI0010417FA9|nr:SAF domain-containing protein [Protofrankia symbiont of Coriaria ruscifolia]